MKRLSTLLGLVVASLMHLPAFAQDAPPPPPDSASVEDFDAYGDAGEKPKTYATQKVLFLSPTKLISIGFEGQTPFDLGISTINDDNSVLEGNVNRFSGLRLGANFPVISRNSFILNLGVNYWETAVGYDGNFRVNPAVTSTPQELQRLASVGTLLDRGLRSTGIQATVFKPFNNRNFLIVQAQADVNGTYRNVASVNWDNSLTYSGTAIYGWKKNDSLMWGVGVTRTYRAGQVLHIPVLYYNRTWNQKWGAEVIFPARANLRRNFGTTSLLMLGYEIEGNAYYLDRVGQTDLFLRRGELKPRLTYERQISGFIWLSAQAGYRHNWRFDIFDSQNPTGDNNALIENRLPGAFYFNFSLNLVSP